MLKKLSAKLKSLKKLPVTLFTMILLMTYTYADSPWEKAVDKLQKSFTGPIAKGLSLVAIVIGGLMFAYGEGGSKRLLAGIVFGIGMAVAAANFLTWLFGV